MASRTAAQRAMAIVDRVLPPFPFNGFSVTKAGIAHDWAAIDRQAERRKAYRAIRARILAKRADPPVLPVASHPYCVLCGTDGHQHDASCPKGTRHG